VRIRKCSEYRKFLNAEKKFFEMLSFQFVLFEAAVLLREVTRDILSHRASREQTVLSVTSLYVCQSHTAVRLLGKGAGSMQDSAKTISVAIKYCVLWNKNEQSGNTWEISQLTYN
jgi:hypothetical protein